MDLAISSQAARIAEGSTTNPQGCTAKRLEMRGSFSARFLSKIDTEISQTFCGGSRCYEWTGAIAKNGYGQVRDGKTKYAHRVSWEWQNGSPDGWQVLHRCDNRKCVNPAHLFLGTLQDNMADMLSKNRQAKGERSGLAKLKDADVEAIRSSQEKQAVLAARYGVSQPTISALKNLKYRVRG